MNRTSTPTTIRGVRLASGLASLPASPPMRGRIGGLLVLILIASAGCAAAPKDDGDTAARPRLGLMTSLPIFWGEGGDVQSVLSGGSPPGWVRPALEAQRDPKFQEIVFGIRHEHMGITEAAGTTLADVQVDLV